MQVSSTFSTPLPPAPPNCGHSRCKARVRWRVLPPVREHSSRGTHRSAAELGSSSPAAGLPAGAPCTGSTRAAGTPAAVATVSGRDVGSWRAPAGLPESTPLPVLRTGNGGKVPYKPPGAVLRFSAPGSRALCWSRRGSSPRTMARCLWPLGRAATGTGSAAGRV